ncbi:winged helix-turn-helix transcriptional regulator [Pantoea brenneri]|uniref:winged helix-turn-helix transcriptional regulator n=1 Tax=Pantoea brenneri TaxID=472694 RepID=UPI0028A0EBE2|nr:winged helix-turn-helix transcriptional regulator [Pantoea brenneri]
MKDPKAEQVLLRTDYKKVPPRVDYSLTPPGSSLSDAIITLCNWGTKNAEQMTNIFASRESK